MTSREEMNKKDCGCGYDQECPECDMPYEYRKCDCGHRADRVDVGGKNHYVCPECSWMWTYDGGYRVYIYPLEPMQTPAILAKLEQEMRP